jgi:hypothetical protein
MTMITQKTPLVIGDEALTIKTADISLTNKEEPLSAMPLEDKDNQGGTYVCFSNGP